VNKRRTSHAALLQLKSFQIAVSGAPALSSLGMSLRLDGLVCLFLMLRMSADAKLNAAMIKRRRGWLHVGSELRCQRLIVRMFFMGSAIDRHNIPPTYATPSYSSVEIVCTDALSSPAYYCPLHHHCLPSENQSSSVLWLRPRVDSSRKRGASRCHVLKPSILSMRYCARSNVYFNWRQHMSLRMPSINTLLHASVAPPNNTYLEFSRECGQHRPLSCTAFGQ
jgi:hypothetical protein